MNQIFSAPSAVFQRTSNRVVQFAAATFLAVAGLLATVAPAFAAGDPPAAGAATDQVIIASLMVGFVFSVLVLIALAHRSGRVGWLERLSIFSSKVAKLPPWVALPSAVLIVSLLAAVFGLYWDVSLHLSQGRDEGPLANPSHYFILFGLLGCFSAGMLATTMPKPGTRPSPYSIRLSDQWYAPLGGVLIAVSAVIGLIGFPLDDVWHRLFGQDVTLWGPTHLLMLAGASLTLIGQMILLIEGVIARNAELGVAPRLDNTLTGKLRKCAGAGGILIALSIYQGEFDFGIPQFQMIFHPIMLMVAAGVALTFARVWAGRGGAILAALFFIALRSILTLIVTGILDRPTAHFPLYLGSAVAIEVVGLLMAKQVLAKPMQFAAVAGLAVGTFGLAAEWGWSHLWMVFPWTESLWPAGAIAGLIAAVGGAYIGVWIGNSLSLRPKLRGVSRFAPALGLLAIMVLVGYGLNEKPRHDFSAQVTTQTVETGEPGHWVNVTAKLNTTYFDDDAQWIQGLAWQGPGFVNTDVERIAPGTFRFSEPLPASGKWKTMMRFHKDNSLLALPIYAPRDDAIPAAEIPVSASFTRALTPDREVLQRERKVEGGTLPFIGYFAVFLIGMSLLGVLGWGIHRVGTTELDESGSAIAAEPKSESSPRAGAAPPSGRPVLS